MLRRILCPYHEERTPSFIIYPNGAGHCYSCGAHVKQAAEPKEAAYIQPKEDMAASIDYIKSLPLKEIRGLMLPHDNTHYYIVWPEENYYKKRAFNDSTSKYLSPVGHPKPLFIAKQTNSNWIIVCEGELNALSLAQANLPYTIVSPGPATDFYSKNSDRYSTVYRDYDNVLIIADADKAGTVAAIELKTRLLAYTPNTIISLWNKDANDILREDHGKEKLESKIRRSMGMPA